MPAALLLSAYFLFEVIGWTYSFMKITEVLGEDAYEMNSMSLSSVDNLGKQFGPRPGLPIHRA